MYTSGWIASGPVGVIASTMNGAYETARLIWHDHLNLSSPATGTQTPQGTSSTSTPTSTPTSTSTLILNPTPELDSLPEELQRPSQKVVHMSDWVRIDEEEKKRGRERGKSREKFGTVAEMLRFLG
jgi:adrenodoxin-NADP+ reductase